MRAALLWFLFALPAVWAQESPLLQSAEQDYENYGELKSAFQMVTADVTLAVLADGTPSELLKSTTPLPQPVIDALQQYRFRSRPAAFGIGLSIPVRKPASYKTPLAPEPNAPQAKRGKLTRGGIATKVAPIYPLEAKLRRIQGKVVVSATITKEGKISRVEAVSGPLLLIDAARTAVSQWEYKPYLLDKEPVEVEADIDVVFSLN
jgi:TonB family protein